MTWIKQLFGTSRPIIAMCHLAALPGDPGYDSVGGMSAVVRRAGRDLEALQEGGVDAVMFSNEFSLPYLTKVPAVTTASMARVLGELRDTISVPFGVNVLWDARASLDLAAATDAAFVREIFSGVYASDFGLWDTDVGDVIRHQHAIGAGKVRLLFNVLPEAAQYLAPRGLGQVARTTVFNCKPDALCVSGLTAGAATSLDALRLAKEAVPEIPVFANTGVRLETIAEQLEVADGAVVGTAFKVDGVFENTVDPARVRVFMERVREVRGRAVPLGTAD
jgi:membrane complex biogenesis BtpA family protein